MSHIWTETLIRTKLTLWTIWINIYPWLHFVCYNKDVESQAINYQFYGMYAQSTHAYPDSKVDGANTGPIWGRQGPGGPHVGPMNFAIWVINSIGTNNEDAVSQVKSKSDHASHEID